MALWIARLAQAGEAAVESPSRSPIGQAVAPFSLPDFHGKTYALDDFRDKPVVLAFFGTECPLCRHYAPRLRKLAAEFESQGVAFVGVFSNVQDSLTDIAAFARANELTIPLLKDNNNELADRVGAMRTPEYFLLDRQRVIRYWGRMDDQYGRTISGGYARRVSQHDLADAIHAVLADKPVANPVTKAEGCLIGRVNKIAPTGDVTYSNQIARLLQQRCVECHRPGEAGPFSMGSYEEVVGWAAMIREVVEEGRMPPWFANPQHGQFSNDARLTPAEKQLIATWVDNGCPEGNPQDLPAPREFVAGWKIGEPDQVVYMSEKPFDVPAEGAVEYQRFTVDPGWTTPKWIQASEARPGNRSIVHHMRVDIRGGRLSDGYSCDIGTFVPGDMPNVWPEGTALYVPAGAKLEFEMHYTPNGNRQADRSMLGVRFADPRTVKRMIHGKVVYNVTFKIPPGAPNHEVTSNHTFEQDTLLLYLWPHMHVRGKDFRFEAVYPDGTREILLDVPRFDFNWQLRYLFTEPKLMPRGTRLHCMAHYDNSADNPTNPDPTQTVTNSEQTTDEMMEGTFFAISLGPDPACTALRAISLADEAAAARNASAPAESPK